MSKLCDTRFSCYIAARGASSSMRARAQRAISRRVSLHDLTEACVARESGESDVRGRGSQDGLPGRSGEKGSVFVVVLWLSLFRRGFCHIQPTGSPLYTHSFPITARSPRLPTTCRRTGFNTEILTRANTANPTATLLPLPPDYMFLALFLSTDLRVVFAPSSFRPRPLADPHIDLWTSTTPQGNTNCDP
ncbi:hypothetical protein C8J57DRAFT_1619444 [Mycena rebaudengoi]|nr:hypothetical protein C8J57DRAFT_1619444 [Mycena rebaudengoi]